MNCYDTARDATDYQQATDNILPRRRYAMTARGTHAIIRYYCYIGRTFCTKCNIVLVIIEHF